MTHMRGLLQVAKVGLVVLGAGGLGCADPLAPIGVDAGGPPMASQVAAPPAAAELERWLARPRLPVHGDGLGLEWAPDLPVLGPTGAHTRNPAIASNGRLNLVVWSDFRAGPESDIYAARTTASGELLDPVGILVASGPERQERPAVAAIATGFLVVWEDRSNGTDIDIHAATVSFFGVVTELGVVAGSSADEQHVRLAGLGAEALLVYERDQDVMGAWFFGNGFAPPFAIAATPAAETLPSVAADGASGYLVAWTEGPDRDLRGARVDGGGAVSPAGGFDISAAPGPQVDSSIAFDGVNHIAVWTHANRGLDIYGTRIDPGNLILDTHMVGSVEYGGRPIVDAIDSQILPDISCALDRCLLVWQDRRNLATSGQDVLGLGLHSDLTRAGEEFPIATERRGQLAPRVSLAGSQWNAVWLDQRAAGPDYVYGTAIDSDGTPQDPGGALLSQGFTRAGTPALARGNRRYALLWSDSVTVGNRIRGSLVGDGGFPLGATDLSEAAGGDAIRPAVVARGSGYYAVWSDSRGEDPDILGIALDSRLEPVGGEVAVAAVPRQQLGPRMATDGASALAVWQDRRSGPFDIYGALIAPDGSVAVADIAICDVGGDQLTPAVAYDPEEDLYLVVWTDGRDGERDIYGARVSGAGQVLDPGGVVISDAAGSQLNAAVAYGGGRFLVTWADRRAEEDLFAARVVASAAGIEVEDGVGTGIEVAAVEGSQRRPAVAFVAGSFLIAWEDDRNFPSAGTDIYAGRVSPAGAVLDGHGVRVAGSADSETQPALVGGAPSRALIAYERSFSTLRTKRVAYRGVRVHGHHLQLTPDPAAPP